MIWWSWRGALPIQFHFLKPRNPFKTLERLILLVIQVWHQNGTPSIIKAKVFGVDDR